MILAFTGTRRGMTPDQKARVHAYLARVTPTEVHHGDCIGADVDFHAIASALDIPVVVHPPILPTLRAFCTSDRILPPKPYLDRDRDMVDLADALLATPARGRQSGGTWYTVQYARRAGREVLVIYPT